MEDRPVILTFDRFLNMFLGKETTDRIKQATREDKTIIIARGTPEEREMLRKCLNERGCNAIIANETCTIYIPDRFDEGVTR